MPELCLVFVGKNGRELTLSTSRVRSRCCIVEPDLITPHDKTSWGAAEEAMLLRVARLLRAARVARVVCRRRMTRQELFIAEVF